MWGRLSESELPWRAVNPILLAPGPLATAIFSHFHNQCHHQGPSITSHAMALGGGVHIVGGSRVLKSFLHIFVTCRKLRDKVESQQMST